MVKFLSDSPKLLLASLDWVIWVETDETDEASESLLLTMAPMMLDVVVLVLFFLGNVGSTRPGSSVCSAFCRRENSPYRLPMKYSRSPFFFTLRMNSC